MAFALHATGGELPAHPVDALVEVVEEEQRGHNHDHGDRHPHEGVDHGGDGGIGPHGERAVISAGTEYPRDGGRGNAHGHLHGEAGRAEHDAIGPHAAAPFAIFHHVAAHGVERGVHRDDADHAHDDGDEEHPQVARIDDVL